MQLEQAILAYASTVFTAIAGLGVVVGAAVAALLVVKR